MKGDKMAAAKKILYIGKRHNHFGRWQIKSADGVTHYIPCQHWTELRMKKGG